MIKNIEKRGRFTIQEVEEEPVLQNLFQNEFDANKMKYLKIKRQYSNCGIYNILHNDLTENGNDIYYTAPTCGVNCEVLIHPNNQFKDFNLIWNKLEKKKPGMKMSKKIFKYISTSSNSEKTSLQKNHVHSEDQNTTDICTTDEGMQIDNFSREKIQFSITGI
jgi:hypothetical protein